MKALPGVKNGIIVDASYWKWVDEQRANAITKKCINHRKRNSISVEEKGIPHLCKQCWDSQGMPVKKGDKVICTVSHPSCDGRVERIEDGLAVTKTNDGGESWNPIALLVKSR